MFEFIYDFVNEFVDSLQCPQPSAVKLIPIRLNSRILGTLAVSALRSFEMKTLTAFGKCLTHETPSAVSGLNDSVRGSCSVGKRVA